MQTTIHKCGEKLLIEMPTGLSAKLDWGVGDVLSVEVVEGGLKVERVMTAHDHALEIARECMAEYRETFEALAKS
jgi:antitoxin component of MazEF toxin-antitoxin module